MRSDGKSCPYPAETQPGDAKYPARATVAMHLFEEHRETSNFHILVQYRIQKSGKIAGLPVAENFSSSTYFVAFHLLPGQSCYLLKLTGTVHMTILPGHPENKHTHKSMFVQKIKFVLA